MKTESVWRRSSLNLNGRPQISSSSPPFPFTPFFASSESLPAISMLSHRVYTRGIYLFYTTKRLLALIIIRFSSSWKDLLSSSQVLTDKKKIVTGALNNPHFFRQLSTRLREQHPSFLVATWLLCACTSSLVLISLCDSSPHHLHL